MSISIRKDQRKDAKKFDNHVVRVADDIIGYVGFPSIYDNTKYVFISRDVRFTSLESIEHNHPRNFIENIRSLIPRK